MYYYVKWFRIVLNIATNKGNIACNEGVKRINMGKISKFFKSRLFSLILSVIHIALTFVLLIFLLRLNMLPVKFFTPICFVLLLFAAISFLMGFAKGKPRTIGKILSLFMIILSTLGVYYLAVGYGKAKDLTGANTQVDVVNVYVMKDDAASTLGDASKYTYGILAVLDRENTDKTLANVNKIIGSSVKTEEYEGYIQLVEALFEGEVEAIIMNEAYIEPLVEHEEYAAFKSLTKVLHNDSHTTIIEVDDNKNVSNEPFALYLSGIDIEGGINKKSRSDVNIIAVVNPKTKNVLLVNTPRDFYMPLSVSGNMGDKLTHAGLYGVTCSMDSLEMFYDIELDYYFRINFTGFEDVIDALGGVTVESPKAFTSLHGKYKFVKGPNEMNGNKALCFVRERYAFSAGDDQRGKNQMALIKAIADKAMSPAFLTGFQSLMNSLDGTFETSMSYDQLASIVRKQLDEGGQWTVASYAVSGKGAKMPVYSMSSIPYVTVPDYSTVDKAKELMQMVLDGYVVSDYVIENMDKENNSSTEKE